MFTYDGLSRFVVMENNNPNLPVSTIFRTQSFIWNMDTTNNITVSINKTNVEIDALMVGGVIWNDLKTQFHPIGMDKNTNRVFVSSVQDNGANYDIILVRGVGGPFDNPNYSGILDRGWITLQCKLLI